MTMKPIYTILILCAGLALMCSCSNKNKGGYESTKEERNLIKKGNKEFADSNFVAALQDYTQALAASPGSEPAIFDRAAAIYNYAKTQDGGKRDTLMAQAVEIYESLGNHASDLNVREKANYNLGNIAFAQQDYKKSIEYYKRVLRSNPANQRTRENLRVAQLKLPPEDQNQDQNQDQDQDQQEQNQDQQQQEQEQQQDQQQQPQQQQEMSSNAEQILQTMQNRENQTRENAQKEERQAVQRSTDKPW